MMPESVLILGKLGGGHSTNAHIQRILYRMPVAVVATQEKEKGKIENMPNNTHCPPKKRLLNGESEMQQSTEPPPIQRPSVYTPKNKQGEKKAYT